jgi:hypothetical protein
MLSIQVFCDVVEMFSGMREIQDAGGLGTMVINKALGSVNSFVYLAP